MMKRFWHWFSSPSKSTSIGALLIVGGVGGVIFWGGFNTFMEYTNTHEFCIACHEMGTVNDEYTHSIHYENNSGVRAICSDCHVPRPWVDKLVRKVQATNELYHKFLGTIDTPEKFEAKRMHLANNVWRSMKATDSRECRNCHAFETMTVAKQRNDAQFWHPTAMDEGFTCIDCHKGIAHNLPDLQGLVDDAAETFRQRLANDGRAANTLYVMAETPMLAEKGGDLGVAMLHPGAQVSVRERDGEFFRVELQGQGLAADSTELYVDRTQGIVAASLITASLAYDGDASDDPVTRLSWRPARISGWVSRNALASQLDPAWQYAKVAYENACARCHAVFAPSSFKATEWAHSINNMRRYSDLSKSELDLVLSYLQRKAKSLREY